ncbi:ankyrin-3-like [Anopheles nili]|uniref:ankyrin-3-like n=1 Tax=Anopheles nili TaxID=185578 RepID=UPI00237AF877|nr:ankyrin-3-like [Anopheles nili]
MHSSKFKSDCFQTYPFHRAAANGCSEEVRQQLATGANPYQPTHQGWTALHAAIANNAEDIVHLLLTRYDEDWAVIRETIRHRFLWKTEQTGWINRPTLIAWTEEECQRAMALSASCPAGIPLNLQVFVMLHHPQQGHRFVALDVCNRNKWIDIMRTIRRLLPNGVLSLNRSDMRQDVANYLHLACRLSTKEIIVKLISKGAALNVASGEHGKTPFMAAGETMRKDVIELLFTKYPDRFDPFACDSNGNNLLHVMLQRQQTHMVDYLLKHLLNYRTKALRETEMQALTRALRFVSEEYKFTNVWTFIGSVPMKKLLSKYIKQSGLDLCAPAGETTNLAAMINKGIALDYCFAQIEQHLELLQLRAHEELILHTLIRSRQLTFVKALYKKHGPLVKKLFEAESPEHRPAFELLRLLVYNTDIDGLRFVLEHHREFYAKNVAKVRSVSVRQHHPKKAAYEKVYDLLVEAFPELHPSADDEVKQLHDSLQHEEFYNELRSLRDNFKKTVTRLEQGGKRLDEYLDCDHRTFLHVAASWGDKTLVEKLLNHGMDVMKPDSNNALPIHLVARCESIFSMLLAQNEQGQLSWELEEGYNLLHLSCKKGIYGDGLERLLELGLDVNAAAADGQLPLSLASCCGTVTFLLDHGARVELLNEDLLSSSLQHMQYCAASVLLPKVFQLEWFRKCAHQYLPWMVGSQNRDFFSCSNQRFLEEHPDIRRLLFDSLYEHSREKASELFSRVCHRSILSCAKWFKEYNYAIDYDHRDWGQSTPLLGLVSYFEFDVEDQLEIARWLLQKPIDVNAVDDRGKNALIALASRFRWMKSYGASFMATAESLLQCGAKLDEQDESGNTVLHYAFQDEQWELLELLIDKGANVSVKNASKKLPCEMGSVFSRSLFGFMRL